MKRAYLIAKDVHMATRVAREQGWECVSEIRGLWKFTTNSGDREVCEVQIVDRVSALRGLRSDTRIYVGSGGLRRLEWHQGPWLDRLEIRTLTLE